MPANLAPPAMPAGQIELWDTQTAKLMVDGEAAEEDEGEEGADGDGEGAGAEGNGGDNGAGPPDLRHPCERHPVCAPIPRL